MRHRLRVKGITVFPMNLLCMFLQYALGRKTFFAKAALVWFVARVDPQMSFENTFLIECFVTTRDWALEYFFLSMGSEVGVQPIKLTVALGASLEVTLERAIEQVNVLVTSQMSSAYKPFVAIRTLKGFIVRLEKLLDMDLFGRKGLTWIF